MLSDEEKEALEILNNTEWDGFMITIKNLIEKQSKEIEELKEDKYGLEEEVQMQAKNLMACEDAIKEAYNIADELCNKKWEDKIKAKIEEYENKRDKAPITSVEYDVYVCVIEVLQSLLEKEQK